jgi:dTDP-4-dehydrorhamnose reductase
VGATEKAMKILLFGGSGQLGKTLLEQDVNHELISVSRQEFDLETQLGIGKVFQNFSPDVVINAAAWTDVVNAEKNRDKAFKINADGTRAVAEEAAKYGAKFIHVSTDFVFDGTSTIPYVETSKKNPISSYGESKSKSEDILLSVYSKNSYVIRTSWLYSKHRSNFVKSILAKLLADEEQIPVVSDQIGSPTWCGDLASAITLFSARSMEPGVYHFANTGETSRSNFAENIARLAGFAPDRIKGIQTDTGSDQVRRPSYSVLDSRKFQLASKHEIPSWEHSLENSIQEILKQVEAERIN